MALCSNKDPMTLKQTTPTPMQPSSVLTHTKAYTLNYSMVSANPKKFTELVLSLPLISSVQFTFLKNIGPSST